MAESVQQAYGEMVRSGVLKEDPDQQIVVELLDKLCAHLNAELKHSGLRGLFSKSQPHVNGLYLWGGVGRGKSMLMDMFVSSVKAPKRRVHFHAFMQEIHAALHDVRKTEVDDAIRPVAEAISGSVRLLALDEMQINDITDAMIVGRLFELLLADGVVLVTTSNRIPDDLYKDGLNRDLFLPFIDLLNSRLDVCELATPTDYRQGQLAGQQVYFTPANAAARSMIDAIWQKLTGGTEQNLTLKVKGRETTLRRFHNGAARAAFWDLCGKNLGAADYLALADAVRVLVLEDVPRLSRNNYNEAKRFVVLIDVLYEAGVRLIMSAADEPARLYLEGSGSFEFERTASRLQEMQSEGWGGN